MSNGTRAISMAAIAALVCTAASAAQANGYKLKVTNGSSMPLSPGVVYATSDDAALIQVGAATTAGFAKLCQMGSPEERLGEVMREPNVVFSQKTEGPILPGQSIEIALPVGAAAQSVHFEAMYGKTKDACAIFNSALAATSTGRDEVISTGAFADPALPMSRPSDACSMAASAVDCLRSLAPRAEGAGRVRFFPGYLPSVLNLLESRYGASETQALAIPTSGAARIQIVKE